MIQSSFRATGARRWRSLLAGLISLALVLSFFPGWTSHGNDDAGPLVAIAQSIDDVGGKSPTPPASLHDDHCLTHVTSITPQETAFPIAYASHRYDDASTTLPTSADRLSPFEPPRA